ncbi:MAG: GNAT family N-acetyltransferase [Thermoleophilia bacterium]|nr:GNAT family N-acetyltransferase [Thermoleophilia bacterium]
MTVRGFRASIARPAAALWVELTEWHRQIYAAPEIGGDDPGAAFDEHLERIGPENLWVAEEGGRVVGLAGLIRGGEDLELEPVVVSESCRGRGIGRALAGAVLAAAGDAPVIVRPVGRNAEAIRFFHSVGFDVLSRVELLRHAWDRWQPAERIADRVFRA